MRYRPRHAVQALRNTSKLTRAAIISLAAALAAVTGLALSPGALAGQAGAHFVGTPVVSVSGSTVSVSAEEAGLGNVPQIYVVLSGTMECVNGGGNHPQAANKAAFVAEAYEPVQNGHSDYTISATATFQPSCSPPMTVRLVSGTLTDETTGLTFSLSS